MPVVISRNSNDNTEALQLADLALPLIIMLGGQVLLMFLYSYFVVYRIMGRDYDSAVLTAGM